MLLPDYQDKPGNCYNQDIYLANFIHNSQSNIQGLAFRENTESVCGKGVSRWAQDPGYQQSSYATPELEFPVPCI